MSKKLFVFIGIILCTVFSFTVCFANTNGALSNTANNVRNFVGGVENTAENAAKDVSNASKDATGSAENAMNMDNNGNNGHTTNGRTSTDNNGRYTAARTSTDNNFMGMTSNTWTWLILGIVAIAIIAVVWYYSMQFANNNHNDNNE